MATGRTRRVNNRERMRWIGRLDREARRCEEALAGLAGRRAEAEARLAALPADAGAFRRGRCESALRRIEGSEWYARGRCNAALARIAELREEVLQAEREEEAVWKVPEEAKGAPHLKDVVDVEALARREARGAGVSEREVVWRAGSGIVRLNGLGEMAVLDEGMWRTFKGVAGRRYAPKRASKIELGSMGGDKLMEDVADGLLCPGFFSGAKLIASELRRSDWGPVRTEAARREGLNGLTKAGGGLADAARFEDLYEEHLHEEDRRQGDGRDEEK